MSRSEPDLEALLAELEEIVSALGSEGMELEDALQLFETGVARLRAAARLLDAARGRVQELIEEASGELRLVGLEVPREEEEPASGGESEDVAPPG